MLDLRAKPYYLEDADIRWVEETIASMPLEEKIGQLFVNMGASRDYDYLPDVLEKYRFGAVRYNPGKAAEVHEQNRILQVGAARLGRTLAYLKIALNPRVPLVLAHELSQARTSGVATREGCIITFLLPSDKTRFT